MEEKEGGTCYPWQEQGCQRCSVVAQGTHHWATTSTSLPTGNQGSESQHSTAQRAAERIGMQMRAEED